MAVKTKAVPASAASACRPRVWTSTMTDEAPLLLDDPDVEEAGVADPVSAPEIELVTRDVVKEPVAVNAPRTEDVFEAFDVVLEVSLPELLPVADTMLDPEAVASFRYDGGADAFAALTRVPVPHLIPSVVSEGSTVLPLSSLMAKRPVQNKFDGSFGVENW